MFGKRLTTLSRDIIRSGKQENTFDMVTITNSPKVRCNVTTLEGSKNQSAAAEALTY